MVWVLLAKPRPIRRVKWHPMNGKGVCSQGNRVDDTWWSTFRTRAAAEAAGEAFRKRNRTRPGEVRIRRMARIPAGWR